MPPEPRISTTGRLRLPIPTWTEHARCAQIGPEEWFRNHRPDEWHHEAGLTRSEVCSICHGCPVLRHCLQASLMFNHPDVEPYGVWAGSTAHQRREMRQAVERGLITIDRLSDRIRTEGAVQVSADVFRMLNTGRRRRHGRGSSTKKGVA